MEDKKLLSKMYNNAKQAALTAGFTKRWIDLRDYVLPRSGRYLESDSERMETQKYNKIINSTGTFGVRTLAAGMQGGLTSPSRAWFELKTTHDKYSRDLDVQQWLQDVRDILLSIFAKSNFYQSSYNLYKEIGTHGVAALLIEEDMDKVVRFTPFTIGEYYIELDESFVPCTLFRKLRMTAYQMVTRFGRDNVSRPVIEALRNKKSFQVFDVVNVIMKNNEYLVPSSLFKDKEYVSYYFEESGEGDKLLETQGYFKKPFISPRWEVTSTDTYGGSPAMDMLGDIKMLQKLEQDKLKTLSKHVDPPMMAPNSMKNKGGTIVAGGVNYVDVYQGMQGFAPVYQTSNDIQSVMMEIKEVEQRIQRGMYNDLFISLLHQTKRMTATEVAERHEEKLMMLGPVLESLEADFFEPVIERTYDLAVRQGLIPQPPESMQEGFDIKIEYISMLSQAQKMIGTRPIEQMLMFSSSIAGMDPTALDRINFDESLSEYARLIGVPARVLNKDEVVQQIREARAEAQQAAQQQEQLSQEADTVKNLSIASDKNQELVTQMTGI